MHHLPTRASTRFLLFSLLCAACSYWNACKQNDKAPPAQPPAAQAPQEEEVLYAGHSITDSVGEIADRKAHYDTLLQLLNDPFRGKDELGPAHRDQLVLRELRVLRDFRVFVSKLAPLVLREPEEKRATREIRGTGATPALRVNVVQPGF